MNIIIIHSFMVFAIYLLISFVFTCVIFSLSYFLAIHKPDSEKLSSYECGFDPYDDARSPFDIRFYLIAILFIIFDLEAVLIFPWTISVFNVAFFGFWVVFDFLIELLVGYVYVWKVGGLEWD